MLSGHYFHFLHGIGALDATTGASTGGYFDMQQTWDLLLRLSEAHASVSLVRCEDAARDSVE